MFAIDTSSNQSLGAVGVLPTSTAITLNGTYRGDARTGFIEAADALSTENPNTRDLYILNSQSTNSLSKITDNL